MVSFQCHACSDVVKKPKLDQHRSRCGSGFDCIDCSTTFNTPAEYKSHTQCISEAEKYQKSLYKGPKTNPGSVPRNNYPPSMNGSAPPQQFGGGYGGRGRGGRRGGWGQPRTVATGANDTPLGTPARSPPTHTTMSHSAPEGGDDAVKESPAVVEVPRELSENKKEKKRKVIAADVDESLRRTSKKAKVTEPEAADPSSTPPLSSPVKVNVEKKSKRKKGEKKDEEGDAADEQDDEARQRKKRRKDKKESKSGSDDAEKSVPPEEVGKNGRKKKKAKGDAIEISGQEFEMKEANVDGKKSKKDKKERKARECSEAGLGATGPPKKLKRQEIELEGDGFQQETRSMTDDTKEVDSFPTAGSQASHKAKKEKRVKKDKDGKEQEKKSKSASLGSVHVQ